MKREHGLRSVSPGRRSESERASYHVRVSTALLWCVSIPPACYGRLMSLFPAVKSQRLERFPQKQTKTRKTWPGQSERPRQMLPPPPTRLALPFFPNTGWLLHTPTKHKWSSHQYSQAGLSTSLSAMHSPRFQSHLSQPTSTYPDESLDSS